MDPTDSASSRFFQVLDALAEGGGGISVVPILPAVHCLLIHSFERLFKIPVMGSVAALLNCTKC